MVTSAGRRKTDNGRLCFPGELIERAMAGLPKTVVLSGQKPEHEMVLCGTNVYTGTGGAAPHILDLETGK